MVPRKSLILLGLNRGGWCSSILRIEGDGPLKAVPLDAGKARGAHRG